MEEAPEAVIEGASLRLLGGREEGERLQSVSGGGFGQCPWRKKRLGGGSVHGGDDEMASRYGWLQLTLEEGYYLTFDACALRIRGLHTAEEALALFTAAQPTFPSTCAVYRHYRKLSWVPRSGIKYGIDFLLYASREQAVTGGEHQHAPYSVLVRGKGEVITWRRVQSCSRLASQVSKELILATAGAECGGEVSEVLLDRWEPERERSVRVKGGGECPKKDGKAKGSS